MNAPLILRLGVGLLLLAGCGGDGDNGTGPGPQGLIGSWEATSVEMVNAANPSQKVDLVSLGGTLILEFKTNQTCRWTPTFPGEPDEVIDGSWSRSQDVLTIQYGFDYLVTWQFDWSLSGNTLRLSGAHGQFDFDGDDEDDEAIMNLVLVRQ